MFFQAPSKSSLILRLLVGICSILIHCQSLCSYVLAGHIDSEANEDRPTKAQFGIESIPNCESISGGPGRWGYPNRSAARAISLASGT
jgi:hypothetical protein